MIRSQTASRVALFLSADIVGSTAYKVAAYDQRGRPHWLEAFETLFRELPLVFIGQVAAAGLWSEHVPDCGVWKVLGDEVIFIGMPADVEEAEILATAFVRTVEAYDDGLARRWPLRVRGSCWAAEMGERNRMIEIPEMFSEERGRPYLDFLGPDVDLGFRLSAHSAPGRVIVSPNLAESLAADGVAPRLLFHPIGERSLKGVCSGRPIPLILMSCASENESEDGRSSGPAADLPSPANRSQLRADLAARRQGEAANHDAVMAPPVFAPSTTWVSN
ncbi:MAG: hypothetical protein ACKV19_02915 [Verrucomicrobiales bacterium]